MKIGIGSWTFPWAVGVPGHPQPAKTLDPFTLLKTASNLGADVVQYADNMPLHELDRANLEALCKQAEAYGLVIEVGTRGHDRDRLLTYLDIARTLGANLVRTLIAADRGRQSAEQAAGQLKQVVPEYEKHGIRLAVENYELYSAGEYKTIMQAVNSGSVGICLDTINNFGTLETPDRIVDLLGEYVLNLHFKDFSIGRIDTNLGYRLSGTRPGTGALNAAWLIEKIGAYQRCGTVVLEQWMPFFDDIETTIKTELSWACTGVQHLRDCIDHKI